MMSIGMLSERERDPERLDILDTLETSARRGADMVQQVLSFARGVEGRRVQVDVGDVRARRRAHRQRHVPQEHRRADRASPTTCGRVSGDPTQLHQVLLNLCVNARDAMPDGGTLFLAAENVTLDAAFAGVNIEAKAGPHVLLKVQDTGTGIPPEILDRIFEPFFTTKDVGKGTGLGLSTSLAIVKSHGGFIRVESEPGAGTTFSVYLPAQRTPRSRIPRAPGTSSCRAAAASSFWWWTTRRRSGW